MKLIRSILLLLVAVLLIFSLACGKTAPASTEGTISGTLTLPAGVSGDLNNTRVAIYASYDDWNYDRTLKYVAASGSGASASYTISDVTPGNYYLDAWKDVDNSGGYTTGDFWGCYGTTQWRQVQR